MPAAAPGLALGMRRLSIIDLAAATNPSGTKARTSPSSSTVSCTIIATCENVCHSAATDSPTQSDTEILVHAWEEWGEDALTELRGMFCLRAAGSSPSFCHGADSLPGARSLGIKPLYYTQTPEGFAFASEVRALLASGAVPKRLSQDAVTAYLLFGSVSEPVTILEGLFPFLREHRMLLHVPERRRTRERGPGGTTWFRPRHVTRVNRAISLRSEKLRPLLEDAVRAISSPTCQVGCFFQADWTPARSRRSQPST